MLIGLCCRYSQALWLSPSPNNSTLLGFAVAGVRRNHANQSASHKHKKQKQKANKNMGPNFQPECRVFSRQGRLLASAATIIRKLRSSIRTLRTSAKAARPSREFRPKSLFASVRPLAAEEAQPPCAEHPQRSNARTERSKLEGSVLILERSVLTQERSVVG